MEFDENTVTHSSPAREHLGVLEINVMFPGFDLSTLPFLPFSQKDSLPACSAVYFAVDSKNRVLYVGQAINLLARWKNHHRFEQLNRINRRNQIKIAWLSCPSELKVLLTTETYFIGFYQPLLNRTPVPAKRLIPTETVLQQTLRKLANLEVVVFGFEPAVGSLPPTVYLKYPIEDYRKQIITSNGSLLASGMSNTGPVNNIIKANNNRKTGRFKWREYERKRFYQAKVRSWKSSCNGVNIELSPWGTATGCYFNFRPQLGENAVIQTVAGVEIPTLNESELTNILNRYPFIRENYPRISVLEHDPIPLRWTKQ